MRALWGLSLVALGQSPRQASLHDAKVVSARHHEISSLIMIVTGNKPLTQETGLPTVPSSAHSQSLANHWPVSCRKTVDCRRRLLKLWKSFRNQRSWS